ncbi:MAG: tRNA (adenosine(37)-N6)-threonylcarbamoyltransferase complex ATPase subunit type 1 TsaE [Cytophaga sp.]|uniref:tRNA (adenosine(37)-N6)-threonylcarbamoyltransferase complex ATPase subunit type 1 TsaE n=1 Tax=Cytophaga sp. TaxID=29535 RepID=UPI003F7E6DF8
MFTKETNSDVLRFECHSPEETTSFLGALMDFAQGEQIWLLEGDMGAGKTTFVRQVGEFLGFVESVQSPTFSIVNEYRSNSGKIYYHFDFYRINSEREAFEIGVEDYFYSGNMCFIEWSSRIPSLLPETYLQIKIDSINEHSRAYTITHKNTAIKRTI